MAAIGISWQRTHADDEAAFGRCGDADICAELVALVRLALRDAVDGRFMQAVNLLAILRLLREQPVHQRYQLLQPRVNWPLSDRVQLHLRNDALADGLQGCRFLVCSEGLRGVGGRTHVKDVAKPSSCEGPSPSTNSGLGLKHLC